MSSGLEAYNDYVIDELKDTYSDTVVDHAVNPRNVGSMKDYDGFSMVSSSCDDTIQLWLKVRDNRIIDICFWTDGCGATIAAGSMMTELAKGSSISEALAISQQNIADALNGLPEGNLHCALLASNTLKEAVRDYLAMKKEPWKKAYRK